jgi:hypothetical protein
MEPKMHVSDKSNPNRRFLCLVDGSNDACSIAEHTTMIAKSLGASLSFLAFGKRLQPQDSLDHYMRIEGVASPPPVYLTARTNRCLNYVTTLAQEHGLSDTRRLVRNGNILSTICSIARSEGAELVVGQKTARPFSFARTFSSSLPALLRKRCGLTVLSDFWRFKETEDLYKTRKLGSWKL